MNADAVVIGAGFAGLSTAVRLADAGLKVVVAEAAPRLGGRASAFTDRDTGERLDNGQHVLFGCYRETYAFLRCLGTDRLAPLDRRLNIAIANSAGVQHVLACPPWPPPWHLIAGVLRWRAIALSDRLTALRLAPFIKAARHEGSAAAASRVPADDTVADWLVRHRQSAALCRWLWHPLAVAALNQSPKVAAARPFARVLGELFGSRADDSAVGLSTVPLDELYAGPAKHFVESRGGSVLIKAPARIVCDDGGRLTHVRAGDITLTTAVVVSAVPWHAFARLWDGAVPDSLTETAAHAASMEDLPIVTVNFWFDRPVMRQRFVGLLDGPMHWAFDKSIIFGAETGHLSVVSSGAIDLAGRSREEIVRAAREQLQRALPIAMSASLRRALVVCEHRATFSVAPNAPPRPATRTAVAGLYLAGDWIDTGLPGTIEGAVLSGRRAAEAVIADTCRPTSTVQGR